MAGKILRFLLALVLLPSLCLGATLTRQTAATGDDGWVTGGGSYDNNDANTYLGDIGAASQEGWARFPNVTIPAGSTITNAVLSYKAYIAGSSTTVNSIIYGNDADDAVAPADAAGYAALTLTTASVDWDSIGAWVQDTWYDSPNLATIIQEIIDRVGWASGQAIMLVHKNDASSGNAFRVPSTYDDAAGDGPKLTITYTPPAGAYVPRNSAIEFQ